MTNTDITSKLQGMTAEQRHSLLLEVLSQKIVNAERNRQRNEARKNDPAFIAARKAAAAKQAAIRAERAALVDALFQAMSPTERDALVAAAKQAAEEKLTAPRG